MRFWDHARSRHIPFNHTALQAQQNMLQLLARFAQVVSSGNFFEGAANTELKQQIETLFPNRWVTLVGSGHDSILLSLQALQLAPQDEVIFPVNVYPTALPIALSGVTPIPVEVDVNGQLDPQALLHAISTRTKAVVIVHLYGLVGQLDEVVAICKKKKIILIEDCAQAFHSYFLDQQVGSFGDIACFSFYPTKNFGTLGDGGAIVTKNPQYAAFFEQAKRYGEKKRYYSQFPSGHSRLPELQATVLASYFPRLQKDHLRRAELYQYYCSQIRSAQLSRFVRPMISNPRSDPFPHLFVVEVEHRPQLQKFLHQHGVETLIHYPFPVHQVPAFRRFGWSKRHFPIAESLAPKILSLPFHQYLRHRDIDQIIRLMQNFYQSR